MPLDLLEKRLILKLNETKGIVGLYFEDLHSGKTISINGDYEFSAASTIKVPLVLYLLVKADKNLLDLGQRVEISESNRVGGAGIIKELDKGFIPTILDLAKLTIILSDNRATNQLIDIVGGTESVTDYCASLNLHRTRLQRKMMDLKAIKEGRDNITTPKEMGLLLSKLAQGKIGSNKASKTLISIMKKQQFNEHLPGLIPSLEPDDPNIDRNIIPKGRVVVAHKTGSLENVNHDMGIFYLPDGSSYILSIYTKNINIKACPIIAELSKITYESMVEFFRL